MPLKTPVVFDVQLVSQLVVSHAIFYLGDMPVPLDVFLLCASSSSDGGLKAPRASKLDLNCFRFCLSSS